MLKNVVTYTYAKIQNTALHLFELLSTQFLRYSPKIRNQLFLETFLDVCYFSFKSVPQQGWKIWRVHHEAKHWKIWFFSIASTTFTKVEGRVVSGKLEHKLQAAVPGFCWYFFNLNEKTVMKKKINFFIFNSWNVY